MSIPRASFFFTTILFFLTSCSDDTQPLPLAPVALDELISVQQTPHSAGQQVYEGMVYSLDSRPEPLFRYERRVRSEGTNLVSNHVTYDSAGSIVVIQSAEHTSGYDLLRAGMIHRQTGASGSVEVSGNRALFTLDEGGRVSRASEKVDDPVVAGPTMFGYIVAHWHELMSGAALPIRFALIERLETIGFTLERVDSPQDQTTIRMQASNPLLRLAVASTYFHFDTKTRKILEYTGRVPPLESVNGRLRALDARVAYHFVAADFR